MGAYKVEYVPGSATIEENTSRLVGLYQLGQIVAGRYRLEEKVGAGGCGVVFRATQLEMNRQVALKLLVPQHTSSDKDIARFRREARITASLEHPHTVRLYDFGHTENGVPYTVCELLEGKSLEQVVVEEGPLPVERVVHIATQVLGALGEAHERGILHRDIKPDNIFLTQMPGREDYARVLDFGVAKPLPGSELDGTQLTGESTIIGTPAYMAPELITGDPIGPYSDIYAVGLVLAELLMGHMVFDAALQMEVLRDQLIDNPAPLPREIEQCALGPTIARAIQKIPSKRYASAAEMLFDVERCLSDTAQLGINTAPGYDELRAPGPVPGPLVTPTPGVPVESMSAGAQLPAMIGGLPDTEYLTPATSASGSFASTSKPKRSPTLLITVLVLGGILVGLLGVAGWMAWRWLAAQEEPRPSAVAAVEQEPAAPAQAPAPVAPPPLTVPMPVPIPVLVPQEPVADPPLDPSTIRQRITQAGWTVTDSHGESTNPDFDWERHLASQGSERATVNVYIYRDAAKAAAGEAMLRRQNRAVARRDLVVVYVYREVTDQVAWQLLHLIIN